MTDMTLSLMNESVSRMEQRATTAWAAIASGVELETYLKTTRQLLAWTPLNTFELRRRISTRLSEVGAYPALVGG